MEKQGKWLAPVQCAMMPLIPLSYLYVRNAEYINAVQVGIVGAALAALSLIGFWLFRFIFKSRLAALLGCLTGWVFFFAMRSASTLSLFQLDRIGFDRFLLLYGAVSLVFMLTVMFVMRGRSGGRLYPALLLFFGLLLAYNAVPAVITGVASERDALSAEATKFKSQFTVSESAPSPNVYWFHCDAMLGFDAFNQYYGDDQAEFVQALNDRGFQINRGAMLEAKHATKYAVPSLMCPDFYDSTLSAVFKDHETAMANASTLSLNALKRACMNNETRLAFEHKGYFSQTFSSIDSYYPPVSDRVYSTGDSSAFILETDDNFKQQYLSVLEAEEFATLLTGIPSSTYLRVVMSLADRGLLNFQMRCVDLTNKLSEDQLQSISQGKKIQKKTVMMMGAINDSFYSDQPTFDIFFYLRAHYPFTLKEDGTPNAVDVRSLQSYAPQHRYVASTLLVMVDEILERDPDAVIVLQADHGLHGNTEEEITDTFGKDAVQPIWNQVLSALRVPKKYQNGEESYALSDPLNMSRYLVNAFVGKNYTYIQ
jgi:hypothetical protein